MSSLLIIFFITLLTVVGDAQLKKASHLPSSYLQPSFYIGLCIYIITAFLWIHVYRSMKFSLSGIIYSILTMIIFVAFGMIFFKEKLITIEYIGLLLGILSIILLARFA